MIKAPEADQPSDHADSKLIRVNVFSLIEAIDVTLSRAQAGGGFVFYTLNLDHLVKMRDDQKFRDAYPLADFVSADGWPIVWSLRREGVPIERATGADIVSPLCARAAKAGLPIYLVGPMPEPQQKAVAVLKERTPDLQIAGAESPLLAADNAEMIDALAARINASGARLCFLCLGAPKQELIAARLRQNCPQIGFYCVGAALDFIGGTVVRAPLWMQNAGLEWLWRLGKEPRRLFIRYLRCGYEFALIVLGKHPLWRT